MLKYQSTFLLAIALFSLQGGAGIAIGDTAPPAVVLAVKTGMVTGVSANDIQIDGYSFRIKVGAEILDDKGVPLMDDEDVPLPVTKIALGSAVKFFLKAGEIQKMMVTFPQ